MNFFNTTFYNNTILNWFISIGIIIGSIIISKIVFKLINKYVKKITEKTKSNYDDIIVDKIEEPLMFLIIIIGYFISVSYLTIPESLDNVLFGLGKLSIVINFTWMLSRVLSGVSKEFIKQLIEKDGNEFYGQILPLLIKGINVLIWSIGIIIGLDNIGVDVTAMIAGLGVGGLALALAAQDVVKNVFGGIMIFLDKPFKIGERIQVDGYDGTVEEIGLRSTRVRALEGRIITIPNSSFSDNSVVNVTSEPSRKIVTNLGLTYDMTPGQMDLGMDILKIIAETNHNLGLITDDYAIGFNNFGDFSLGLLFVYRIEAGQDNLGVQTGINKTILKQFNANGLEMAFPTQTIYNKK